jgi:hypothetical protein
LDSDDDDDDDDNSMSRYDKIKEFALPATEQVIEYVQFLCAPIGDGSTVYRQLPTIRNLTTKRVIYVETILKSCFTCI